VTAAAVAAAASATAAAFLATASSSAAMISATSSRRILAFVASSHERSTAWNAALVILAQACAARPELCAEPTDSDPDPGVAAAPCASSVSEARIRASSAPKEICGSGSPMYTRLRAS